ncbi:uncharacterized protein LOC105080443 isoform X4 [Camelus bactrianus]|uniref:Uncharacterized protein LOC105080443 isoform X4 n=1 Tax=Camelus bactrianus TaxID=9837 RepID=A0AC58PKB5_CAMBA
MKANPRARFSAPPRRPLPHRPSLRPLEGQFVRRPGGILSEQLAVLRFCGSPERRRPCSLRPAAAAAAAAAQSLREARCGPSGCRGASCPARPRNGPRAGVRRGRRSSSLLHQRGLPRRGVLSKAVDALKSDNKVRTITEVKSQGYSVLITVPCPRTDSRLGVGVTCILLLVDALLLGSWLA